MAVDLRAAERAADDVGAAHPGAYLATGTFGPGMAIVSGCDGSRMRGNIDAFVVATGGQSTFFDFELLPAIPALETYTLALLATVLLLVGIYRAT